MYISHAPQPKALNFRCTHPDPTPYDIRVRLGLWGHKTRNRDTQQCNYRWFGHTMPKTTNAGAEHAQASIPDYVQARKKIRQKEGDFRFPCWVLESTVHTICRPNIFSLSKSSLFFHFPAQLINEVLPSPTFLLDNKPWSNVSFLLPPCTTIVVRSAFTLLSQAQ